MRVRTVGQQDTHDDVMRATTGCAQRGMQRGLACAFRGSVDVGSLLDQEFTQLPMAMKRRSVQPMVLPELRQRLAAFQQESNRAHVAVVCAPPHERHAVGG